jgi:dihydroorotate dehydrogenase electron transfer subunit
MTLESEDVPGVGQPLLAFLPGSEAPLRTALYASEIHPDGITTAQIPSAEWRVGTQVDLLGPIGRGFSPSTSSRRWLLIALGVPLDRLLPLVISALERDLPVVVHSDQRLPDLPAQVEVAVNLDEVFDWADFIAIDTDASRLNALVEVRKRDPIIPAVQVQALLDLPLPCGLGVCSACAVRKGRSWKLACQHGPVFDIKGWLL